MERILNQIDFEESTMDEIIEKAYFDVAEEGYSEDEVGKCFNLVMRLLSMELGTSDMTMIWNMKTGHCIRDTIWMLIIHQREHTNWDLTVG